MEKMKLWSAVCQPPKSALKEISAGRLRGKTDINPQWRYKAMTEQFGPCGIGWKYEISRLWTEPGPQEQVFAFAEIKLFLRDADAWSEPIPGIGGSMLVEMESKGLHASDEGYKMAVTDALSVAMKMIGVAGDIYAGLWNGSKYIKDAPPATPPPPKPPEEKAKPTSNYKFLKAMKELKEEVKTVTGTEEAYYNAMGVYGVEHANEIVDEKEQKALYRDLRSFLDRQKEAA
jgi:hypothetical protein